MTDDWRLDAACDGLAPLFDSHLEGESTKQRRARHERAKDICRRCPVFAACALDVVPGIDDGVRAGRLLPEPSALAMARWRAGHREAS